MRNSLSNIFVCEITGVNCTMISTVVLDEKALAIISIVDPE